MSKITQGIWLVCTYGLAFFNIVITFELVKSVIIFLTTMVLLYLQIKLHLKRLKKEEDDDSKKNQK